VYFLNGEGTWLMKAELCISAESDLPLVSEVKEILKLDSMFSGKVDFITLAGDAVILG